MTSDDSYCKFTNIMFSFIEVHVPSKSLRYDDGVKVQKHPRHIMRLMNKKAAIGRKMKENGMATLRRHLTLSAIQNYFLNCRH